MLVEISINGWLTNLKCVKTLQRCLDIGENVADSGGVALAWDAYREYVTTDQRNTDGGVTGTDGDRMFFLNGVSTLRQKLMSSSVHLPNCVEMV